MRGESSRNRPKKGVLRPFSEGSSLWKVSGRTSHHGTRGRDTFPRAENADEFAALEPRQNRSVRRHFGRMPLCARFRKEKKARSPLRKKGAAPKTTSRSRFFFLFLFFLKNAIDDAQRERICRGAARRDSKCADCICWCQWPPIDSTAQQSTDQTLSFPPSRFATTSSLSLSLSLSNFRFPPPLSSLSVALAPRHPPVSSLPLDHPLCAPDDPLPSRSLTRLYVRDIPL